jgi:hypothetical protein
MVADDDAVIAEEGGLAWPSRETPWLVAWLGDEVASEA